MAEAGGRCEFRTGQILDTITVATAEGGASASCCWLTDSSTSCSSCEMAVTAGETVIASVQVPAGRLVIAVIGAANRDPGRFAAPDTFDITRPTAAVLSFGGGLHYCLGAPLARLEAETFFPALLTRFPGLRLAGEPARQGTVFRGFSDLPVT
jgi:cytochrome P450